MKAGSPEIGLLLAELFITGGRSESTKPRKGRGGLKMIEIVKVSSRLVTDHFVGFCKI
jgi:hypothetical protein